MDILLDSDFEYLRHKIKSSLSTYGYPTLAGERVLVTPEDGVQADGKQRYRFDYFLDGAKTRSRAKFLSKTECRRHAYSLLKLTKSQKIVYNWD